MGIKLEKGDEVLILYYKRKFKIKTNHVTVENGKIWIWEQKIPQEEQKALLEWAKRYSKQWKRFEEYRVFVRQSESEGNGNERPLQESELKEIEAAVKEIFYW